MCVGAVVPERGWLESDAVLGQSVRPYSGCPDACAAVARPGSRVARQPAPSGFGAQALTGRYVAEDNPEKITLAKAQSSQRVDQD